VSRGVGRGRGGGEAARVPRTGAAARGDPHRVEGQRRRDNASRDRHERRAREVSGAARQPGVTPRVVVLAAPSGGGKTTIARELRTRLPETFGYSVSATTRKARPGERDGEAYHFLTRDEFERRREAGEFLESTEYAGERYGTLRSEVERVLRSGKHVVLDVEVRGARQVRKAYPRPASVVLFVIPPSPRLLIERLRKRRTESEAELSQRIDIATREVETARREIGDVYDRVLVNDDLETAVREVIDLVQSGERGGAQRAPGDMASLLSDFVRQLAREATQLKQSTGRSR